MTDLPLKCRCGRVHGRLLSPTRANGQRYVCHCRDCRAYARWLGGDDLLDARGGTDIFQTTAGRLRFDGGADQLRCVRLTEKGLHRWYTGCCRTPVGNTISPRFPFVGLVQPIVDHAATGRTRDEELGKPALVWAKFAVGGKPEGAHDSGSIAVVAGAVGRVLVGVLSGYGGPSPFAEAGRWRVEPEVLSPETRAGLRDPR